MRNEHIQVSCRLGFTTLLALKKKTSLTGGWTGVVPKHLEQSQNTALNSLRTITEHSFELTHHLFTAAVPFPAFESTELAAGTTTSSEWFTSRVAAAAFSAA